MPLKSRLFSPLKKTNSKPPQPSVQAESERFERHVSAVEAGIRLDSFIADHLPGVSRSRAAALVRQGAIQVDGASRKPSYKVTPGDTIAGCIPPPTIPDLMPEPLPLDVLFEDESLIVIAKPAGLVVHPAAGHADGTLVNALLHHCPDLAGIGGERRPGIVHRLDKDTSGVMVVAKNDAAHQALSDQFKARHIQKRYLALVWGSPGENCGTIDLPIGRHPVDRKRMAVVPGRGRSACTLWFVRERFGGYATLLTLDLKTGRTHQIRVHCQAIRHPIIGDPVYGRRPSRSQVRHPGSAHHILGQAERQMLHAARLCFAHPLTGAKMTFEAPLPEDMVILIEQLRMP
ncbi:RluA family pseudouridine synthase [Desulfatitalea alkaliphila]|uniref:Pseudouridine synthase n=1 Tax=Desulfatitalea alkaliphila TaxID=2929485 RepID=A0AA41R166_9BACT|nr:RluA family pseudouridine synthase [Desulfatitalea alkaliphila]MCJ8500464.1 RluA family pseudouridine synthase [Desulfatitalea alkaliphila]